MAESIAEISGSLENAEVSVEPRTHAKIIEGRRDDLNVRVRCRRSTDIQSWLVETKGAGPRILASAVRRSFGDTRAIKAGAVLDVGSGDAAFDRAWLVEGAPKQTTRSVFDEEVRGKVDAITKGYVDIDGGDVKISENGTFDVADIKQAITAAVAIRRRLIELAHKASTDVQVRRSEEAEVAALRAQREKIWARASWLGRFGIVVFVVGIALALVLGVFYGCGINTLFEK